MAEERSEIEELARQIREVISGNRKFLERIMDEEFEPEDEGAPEEEEEEELPVV